MRFRCVFWLCRNDGKSRQKLLCKYHLFLLCGIHYLVVHRKIIRKVNDNDEGRALGCALFGVRGSSAGNAGAR